MGIRSFIKHVFCLLFPQKLIIKGKPSEAKRIALTFDDGPHPVHSEKILNALEQANVKATFFLSGKSVEKYPEIVKKMYDQGHQVSNHGYWHVNAPTISKDKYVGGVLHTQSQIDEITNHRNSRQFRPPYGSINIQCLIALLRKNYQFVFWSFDSRDSFIRDKHKLIHYIQKHETKAGEVILFHEDYLHTTEALPQIIDIYLKRGFELSTVNDL